MIKTAYDLFPEITYPAITIQDIENLENSRYSDASGEQVSDISIRFTIYGIQTATKTANEVVDDLKNKLDSYLKNDKYMCLKRTNSSPNIPMVNDENVLTAYQTYNCNIELLTNTIYRRY